MITIANYEQQNINTATLPETLKKGHDFFQKAKGSYDKSEAIKKTIDLYLQKLNEYVKSSEEQSTKEIKPKTKGGEKIRKESKHKYKEGDTVYMKETGEPVVIDKIFVTKSAKLIPGETVPVPTTKESYSVKDMDGKKKAGFLDEDEITSQKPKLKKGKEPKPKKEPFDKLRVQKPGKAIEKVSDEVNLIRRYVNMEGKTKTHQQVLSLLNSLQKAIIEKRIRKTSPHAAEIEHIQKELIYAVENIPVQGSRIIRIKPEQLDKLRSIGSSQYQMSSARFLKRYLSIHGKTGVKEKAAKLFLEIDKADIPQSDIYSHYIGLVKKSLREYLDGKTETPALNETSLGAISSIITSIVQGIAEGVAVVGVSRLLSKGLHGLNNTPEIMSIEDAKKEQFATMGLTGQWKTLIGDACFPTHLFFYGKGGSGKSSCALLFADYLAQKGHKVLFVAGEQFGTPAFTQLLNRLNIWGGENFVLAKDLNSLYSGNFEIVVIDSKDSLNMDVATFRALKQKFPGTSFFITSQGTKSGDFRGDENWRNEVDTMICCADGVAQTNDKNRWGGNGEMRVF